MAEVKWIKLSTDIFDNRKIKQIESLPDGDAIVVIWLKILILAGQTNEDGFLYFVKDIPYTDQILATQFDRSLSLVQLALKTFETFGMIEIVNDVIKVSNWERYQSVDKMAEIREYNRLAQQRSREKRKLLQSVNDNVNDMSMTSQLCQDIDIDIDKDIDIEIDKESKKKKNNLSNVIDTYTSDEDVKEAIKSFIDMRKTLKKPMTEKALQMMLTKLDGLASSKKDKIDIINQSVLNSWQSVYPLKTDTAYQKNQNAQIQEHDYSGVQRIDPRQQFKGGK